MMNKGIGFWAMVVIFGVIGLLYTSLKPDSYTEHQQLILEQFELPEDVQFVYFKSGYEGTANVRGRNEFAVATVQLTKEQYETFVDRKSPSRFVPFNMDTRSVDAPLRAGWNNWWDQDFATIVKLDESPYGERTRQRERVLRGKPFFIGIFR